MPRPPHPVRGKKPEQQPSGSTKGVWGSTSPRAAGCRPRARPPFSATMKGEREEVEWAIAWADTDTRRSNESYVNLIPTAQGGTHVGGFAPA